MRKIRVGIVGFGFIGPHHLDAMRRLGYAEIVALATTSMETAGAKAAAHHVPRAYGNWRDLIADPDVEVVDIATPTSTHCPIALAAIAAGKHVIVDKPLALSSAEAQKMYAAASDRGVFHAVTFSIRYNVMLQQLRAMIRKGELGEVRYIHGHYLQEWLLDPRDHNWRVEPSVAGNLAMVADAGAHWYDLAQHLTKDRITRVSANLTRFIPQRQKVVPNEGVFTINVEVPDLGIILFEFENGARANFSTGAIFAGHKNDLSIEVNGANASARWQQEQPDVLWVGHRHQPNSSFHKDPGLLSPDAATLSRLPGGHYEAWSDAFRNLMDRILSAIASGKPPGEFTEDDFPTFATGAAITRLCDAIAQSAQSGGVWTNVAG